MTCSMFYVSACPSFSFPSTSFSSQCFLFQGQFIHPVCLLVDAFVWGCVHGHVPHTCTAERDGMLCGTASQEQCRGRWNEICIFSRRMNWPLRSLHHHHNHLLMFLISPSLTVPHNADFLPSCSACVVKSAQKGLVHAGLAPLACEAWSRRG